MTLLTKNMTSKCYLDANLLTYFKDESSPFHEKAVSVFEKIGPVDYLLFISPLVIDEFLYSLRKILIKQGVEPGKAIDLIDSALNQILSLENLEIISPPTDKFTNQRVIKLMKEFNLRPRDAYHLLIMQENSVSHFATFDSDFKKVFAKKLVKKV